MHKVKGFTLVELAIVMTIIGLLIGGILKGQELLENARVTSTIAQVKSYDAAVTGFRDIYDALPGDLPNAGSIIPGCNVNCTPVAPTAGDGKIVDSGGIDTVQPDTESPPGSMWDESWLFWVHLLKANLVTGINDQSLTMSTPRTSGVTDPAAKVGGIFVAQQDPIAGSLDTLLPGLGLVLVDGLPTNYSDNMPGQRVLSPSRAAQIDRKMDDGKPYTGTVKSNDGTACVSGTGAQTVYNEASISKDCILMFKLQS